MSYRTLTLLIFITITPFLYSAKKHGIDGKLTWDFDSYSGKLIISGNGNMKYDFWGNVKKIKKGDDRFYPWLKYKEGIKTVEIKDGVTSIEINAFEGCKGLSSIIIPPSIKEISCYAFEDCNISEVIIQDLEQWCRIKFWLPTIFNTIFATQWDLFTYNQWSHKKEVVHSLYLSENVSMVNRGAFANCKSIEDLTATNKNIVIKTAAFNGCVHLKNVNIPKTAQIESFSFDRCTELCCSIYDTTTFVRLPISYSGSYTIPNGIKIIAHCAFEDCTNLTQIIMPNTIDTIGAAAFSGCIKLNSVSLPNSITSISPFAFNKCYSLDSIIMPESITMIESFTFSECTGLKKVVIPQNVVNLQIENDAFYHCDSLQTIIIPETTTILSELPSNIDIIRIPLEEARLELIGQSLQLIDANHNNLIETDESCSISFKIHNSGKGTGRRCRVKTTVMPNLPFIHIDSILPAFDIAPDSIININIPIYVDSTAVDTLVNIVFSVSEIQGNGIDSIPFQVSTSRFLPPKIIADYMLFSTSATAEKTEPITITFDITNQGEGFAKDVVFSFFLPPEATEIIQLSGKKRVQWDEICPSNQKTTKIKINTLEHVKDSISLRYTITEKYGKYGESGTIPIVFGKTPTFKLSNNNEEKSLAIAGLPQLIKISRGAVQTLQPDWFKKHNNTKNPKNPFPYAVIKLELKGNKEAVDLAKQRLSVTEGGIHCVTEKDTKDTNTIWFLIHCKHRNISFDCGDGCEPVTLDLPADGLHPNEIWYGQVEVSIP